MYKFRKKLKCDLCQKEYEEYDGLNGLSFRIGTWIHSYPEKLDNEMSTIDQCCPECIKTICATISKLEKPYVEKPLPTLEQIKQLEYLVNSGHDLMAMYYYNKYFND